MTPAPVKHFTLQDPARFLRILPATGGRIDLRDVSLTEMFSLTAMAARARTDTASPLELSWDKASDALKFAEAVGFDFINVRVITQSFAHALLFEALRFAWAAQTPVYVLNAQPVVRSALHHVEMYAQAG